MANDLVRPLEDIYREKDKEELIRILILKNSQLLIQDEEIERLNKLVKFVQTKLNQAIKGEITSDPIVNQVIAKHIERHKQGMENFGITMKDNNKPFKEWVKDAQQESMDQILYLEKTLNKE